MSQLCLIFITIYYRTIFVVNGPVIVNFIFGDDKHQVALVINRRLLVSYFF